MADLRIVDAPVLLQESITDDVKMPTGGLGNYAIRLGDLVWYVVAKENLASKSYVDTSSKGVQDNLDNHVTNKNNPHEVTKEQVGLGSVDNTSDIDKPVSNATKSAIITATTDMATKAYVNSRDGDLSTLKTADKTNLVKAINEVVSVKADKATTLVGYGISDAYTKSEIDTDYGGVKSLYNKNVEAGAGANGWTDQLILLSNGRTQKQKNSDLVTPFDFGAIGDGKHHPVSEWTNIGSEPYFPNLEAIQVKFPHVTSLTDSIDWCAIQAFFDYCKTNVVKDANISGNFSVNKELNFVQGHGALTKTFTGFMKLTATANMHHVIRIAGSFLNMDAFYLRKSSSSLKIPYGLFMGGYLGSDSTICSQIKSIDASGFDMVSVNLDQNTMFCKLGVLRGNGGKVSSFTFSNPVQSGSDNSQRTTLTVSYVPEYRNSIPKLHEKDFQAPNTFVYINNRAHRVEAIDKGLGTIAVYPALFGVTEGTGKCIEGAFYHHGGNNAGCVEVGTLSALGGGTGVSEVALYTATYANIITEYCGIGLVLGANGGDPAMQFNADRIYFEANTIDFIQSGARYDSRTALRSAVGLDENKIFALGALDYLETNGKYASTNTSGRLGAGDYSIKDKVYTSDYSIVKHWSATNSLDIELGGERGIKQGVMGTSQFNINVTVNRKLVELFGRSEMGVHIKHPTNSSLAPTGIIQVTLPTGWKINGVDSNTISYTGFYKAPTLFISVFNAESKLALISIDGLTSDLQKNIIDVANSKTVVYDPPSLATATQQSTTVALTGAKLGDNVSVSFDKALQGTRLWAEVTAADTVTVYHRNDTGVTVDIVSGNLKVKII